MTHLLRGKQAGVQVDLSGDLGPDLFVLDDVIRYGVGSQISQLAYDPIQSLLAVGTKQTQFGPGQIYVFGQKRVSATFKLPRPATVKVLQFCGDRLICLDSKHDLSIYSLETRTLQSAYSPPGAVTAIASDPTLDYVLLGMQNGEVLAYDLDREMMAPLKISNFWVQKDPRARVVPVVSLAFHPRDIGSLLIGYTEGAIVYSFKRNEAKHFYHYHLPKGAPGGARDPAAASLARNPKLIQAVWHPTGTFVLTSHDDSSIVIWDYMKDGRIIMARTLTETNIDKPSSASAVSGSQTIRMKTPLFRIGWCANQDPDDTGILISGGQSSAMPTNGLTFLELGRTPNYATSAWQVLSDYFENPKRQRVLPTPPNAEVVDFCLIPRSDPHFAGAHDPIAVLALLSSGEVVSMSFPSGLPITPTNQLHVSMSFVHPFITRATLSSIKRTRWLGMVESRAKGPPILRGGTEALQPMKRHENRNIVQTAHADGTIRLWDAGHGDEIENEAVLQVDVARAVGRYGNIEIGEISLAGESGELAAGLRSGEVVIFRWSKNKHPGVEPPSPGSNHPRLLTNITERRDPSLVEGLLPFTLLNQQDGPVTALKLSDVGFVVAGFECGSMAVIDLRGPAVIYQGSLHELVNNEKRSTFRKSVSHEHTGTHWASTIEFSVMTLEGDDYSSILCHVGTNLGHVLTFKLLPSPDGRYSVQFSGSTSLDDRVIRIHPLHAVTGAPAHASQSAVSGLRSGHRVNGVLLAVSSSSVRIFKPASNKGAHKSFDSVLCHSATVARYRDQGYALVGLFGDGTARAFSIPALREIGSAPISPPLSVQRLGEACITATGDILGWTGPSEIALLNVWGTGQTLPQRSPHTLFNSTLLIPARPTISNFQWMSGTQYITPADLDFLISGLDRPPSKKMQAQMRTQQLQEQQQQQQQQRNSAAPGKQAITYDPNRFPDAKPEQEGWGAWASRNLSERTEKLGIVGDNMERLEGNSKGWNDDINKFVSQQKKNFVMGAVKSKFGL